MPKLYLFVIVSAQLAQTYRLKLLANEQKRHMREREQKQMGEEKISCAIYDKKK